MFLKIEQMDMQLVGGESVQTESVISRQHCHKKFQQKIHQLLEKYHNAEKITLYDIAKFHAQFENIHPFQDGNGRVGRMIILKQCLDHNIVPMIIRDIHKAEYNRYLNKAQHEQDYKGLEAYFEKEQKYYQESTIPMIFDFDEL